MDGNVSLLLHLFGPKTIGGIGTTSVLTRIQVYVHYLTFSLAPPYG